MLGVTALGADVSAAVTEAYAASTRIRWDGMHYRRDIGRRAVERGAMTTAKPRVAVLMGSDSDWEVMSGAVQRLEAFGDRCDVHVMSAHRTPARVARVRAAARAGAAIARVHRRRRRRGASGRRRRRAHDACR